MTLRQVSFVFARLCFGLLILLTSCYCLLVYIPFTRHSFIEWNVAPWLPVFVRLHPIFYWTSFAALTLTLLPDLHHPEKRRVTVWFIGLQTCAGVMLLVHPLLTTLPADERSFIWSLIVLFPLLLLAAIDFRGADPTSTKSAGNRLSYSNAIAAALFLSLIYVAVFALRYVVTGLARFSYRELLILIGWSIASHIVLFTIFFVALTLINRISARLPSPAKAEFLLRNLLAVILGAMVLRKIVLSSISFNNHLADVFSAALSLSLVTFWSGLRLSLVARYSLHERKGFLHSASQRISGRIPKQIANLLVLTVISGLAFVIPATMSSTDWNSLIQKLSVILVWIISFTFFVKINSGKAGKHYSLALLVIMAAGSLGAYRAICLAEARLPAFILAKNMDAELLFDRYAGYDISFAVARKILQPAEFEQSPATSGDELFFGFLRQNTNVSPAIQVAPVEVNLTPELKPTSGKKPNIFVFVVDSLRQDYISPYNKEVGFTPAIEKFSRDSIVMRNAFTRYGGTGLSEPAIWMGGMQLHRQLIEPVYQMSALQKLIEAEDYQAFVTIDPILKFVLKPSPAIVELDKGVDWYNYFFESTLDELQLKIDHSQEPNKPIFVYTQPQNLHLVSMQKNAAKQPTPRQKYRGFESKQAAQVDQIDSSFGKFIQYLKTRNLYDNSIVILTADHGDSLGEEGHWGHGNSVFAEVIRVPLIMHLPSQLEKQFISNPETIAFLSDITPTLYYLLGHKPTMRNEMFGRPLFTATAEEQTEYLRDSYLVANSYGPVYGILSNDGHSLYIADAVNETDYLYDLTDGFSGGRRRVTNTLRADKRALITQSIQSINHFYKYQPEQNTNLAQDNRPTAGAWFEVSYTFFIVFSQFLV